MTLTFLYSPLSPHNVAENNHPSLLLLFILKELLKISKEVPASISLPPFSQGPFDWTTQGSSTQKLREYFLLLPFAFPELASQVPLVTLDRPIQELFTSLEPFILACGSNENLLLFLIRYQKKLAVKSLLDRICPEGIDLIKEKITTGFKKRGYHNLRWTHSSKTS